MKGTSHLYVYYTRDMICELCGSKPNDLGRIEHHDSCVRPNPDPNQVTFKYGFEVGQVVATNSETMFEGKFRNGEWVNESIPIGTLIEIVAIAPKVSIASLRLRSANPERYDSREYFFNAVLADGSRRERIREDFVTVRKLTREELAQYRRGYAERIERLQLENKARPFIERLLAANIPLQGSHVHVAVAQQIFQKDKVSQEEIDFAKRVNFARFYGAGPKTMNRILGGDQDA
jgi:hypothetical protein